MAKKQQKYPIKTTHPTVKYALDIISGKYLACKAEIAACKRFMKDLERQGTKSFPYVFDYTRADRYFKFVEMCVHVEGVFSGRNIKLEPFQKFDLGNIFGWVHKDTGVRRFTSALRFQSRGQAKSTDCACLSLYGLLGDCVYPPFKPEEAFFELNPEIVTLAVDKAQTKQVREKAFEIARRSPKISKACTIKKTYITGNKRGGSIEAVSREVGNLDGAQLNILIADEWAAQKEDQRVNTLVGSFGKKLQSLLVKITTAGDDAMLKPAKQDYDYAKQILAGDIINENYFVIIREMDEGDDVHDFSLYEKQAPILRSKNAYAKGLLAQIKREHDEAYGKRSVSQIREYLIKRCNLWQVDAEEKYLQSRELEMLRKSVVPADKFMEMIKDKPCVCGIDASKRIDLTATGYIFNLPDNKIGIYAKGFIPEEAIHLHERQDRIPYSYYVKEGYIQKINGQVIDTDVIVDHICDFEEENQLEVREVCLDEAFCYQLEIDLTEGRTKNGKNYACVGVPQTTTALNEPTNDFIELLLKGQLIICENPVFMWCCENAYISEDNGGRRKIKKQNKDSPNRIDLLAAVLNALKRRHILEDQTLINLIETGRFSFFG